MKKFTLPIVAGIAVAAGIAGVALTTEKPLVSVNGAAITQAMLDEQLANIPAQLMQGQEETIKTNILERLIEQELVQQVAEETGITNDADYQQKLAQLTRNFTYQYVLNKKVTNQITEESLKAIYEAQKQNFVMPRAKARHILVSERAEAEAIIKTLEAGSDFATLAQEKSIGPSAENGGELGWFTMTDMVPAFAQAAFALDAGRFTQEPVQTQFGWHVILLEEKDMAHTLPFEAVRQRLSQAQTEQVVTQYLDELRAGATIKYYNTPEPRADQPAAE